MTQNYSLKDKAICMKQKISILRKDGKRSQLLLLQIIFQIFSNIRDKEKKDIKITEHFRQGLSFMNSQDPIIIQILSHIL